MWAKYEVYACDQYKIQVHETYQVNYPLTNQILSKVYVYDFEYNLCNQRTILQTIIPIWAYHLLASSKFQILRTISNLREILIYIEQQSYYSSFQKRIDRRGNPGQIFARFKQQKPRTVVSNDLTFMFINCCFNKTERRLPFLSLRAATNQV